VLSVELASVDEDDAEDEELWSAAGVTGCVAALSVATVLSAFEAVELPPLQLNINADNASNKK
jgi:hypothetical protein